MDSSNEEENNRFNEEIDFSGKGIFASKREINKNPANQENYFDQ